MYEINAFLELQFQHPHVYYYYVLLMISHMSLIFVTIGTDCFVPPITFSPLMACIRGERDEVMHA